MNTLFSFLNQKPGMPQNIQHICMADDDPDDHYLFATALSEVNDTVKLTGFSSCDGLLEFLKTSSDLPDVIVLDMNMPGNDGNKCLLAVKQEARLRHIPVIIYSTSGTAEMMRKSRECGAFDYLLKPSSMHLIRELIKQILAIPVSEIKKGAVI